MSNNAHSELNQKESLLRDRLAVNRTILANERTLLAYVRTALTLFVAGVTFVRFFDHFLIEVVGWVFIPAGIATFLIGLVRYKNASEEIHKEGKDLGNI